VRTFAAPYKDLLLPQQIWIVMDIRQLRYFIAIAEEGSLSAAAQRLNVAQPSLSQHVLTLERDLGVTLLDRSPRGVTLTQSGEILLSHARELTLALERAVDSVRRSGAEPVGEVSFGLPSSVSMVLSVPLAETVRLELPQVRLRAIEAMSGFIQTWLEDQSIDLGILYDVGSVRHLTHRQLMTEELHFFSAPDAWPFRNRAGSAVRLRDMAPVELVLPSKHHGLRTMIDRFTRSPPRWTPCRRSRRWSRVAVAIRSSHPPRRSISWSAAS
jgi:LysR family nitrogen assimilation transcriptional regulator